MMSCNYCCPSCRGQLELRDAYFCSKCSREFPITGGIPDFRLNPQDDVSSFYESVSLEHTYRFLYSERFFYRVKDHFPDLVGFEIRRKELAGFKRQIQCSSRVCSILDLGSADGVMAQFLIDNDREIVCADLSRKSLVRAEKLLRTEELGSSKSMRFAQCNACDLPFTARSFDIVVCTEVIEHVDDSARLVSEINRVLRPDGWLYLTTPNSRGRGVLYGPLKKITSRLGFRLKERRPIYRRLERAEVNHEIQAHVKEFTMGELQALLRRVGFLILEHKTVYITYLDLHMFSKAFLGLDRVFCFYPLIRAVASVEYILSRLLPRRGHIQVCISRTASS
jgi:2-polyprenyl-3-methyl-5-hydroxy-6-metoxy-1,4-benzoquinol methylase